MNVLYNGLFSLTDYDSTTQTETHLGNLAITIDWKNASNDENRILYQTINNISASLQNINVDSYQLGVEQKNFIYNRSKYASNEGSKMDITVSCYNKTYQSPRFTYHLYDVNNDSNVNTAIWFWVQLHTPYADNPRNSLWIDSINIKLHD